MLEGHEERIGALEALVMEPAPEAQCFGPVTVAYERTGHIVARWLDDCGAARLTMTVTQHDGYGGSYSLDVAMPGLVTLTVVGPSAVVVICADAECVSGTVAERRGTLTALA